MRIDWSDEYMSVPLSGSAPVRLTIEALREALRESTKRGAR
jgi:hypothetical protein